MIGRKFDFRNASKPASLIRERLDEQIKEHRQIHADIMSHQVTNGNDVISTVNETFLVQQASVVRMNDSVEAIMQNGSNVKMAKKIESKLKELNLK